MKRATALFLPLSFIPLLFTVSRQFITLLSRWTSRLHLVVLPSCEVNNEVESCGKLDLSAPSLFKVVRGSFDGPERWKRATKT